LDHLDELDNILDDIPRRVPVLVSAETHITALVALGGVKVLVEEAKYLTSAAVGLVDAEPQYLVKAVALALLLVMVEVLVAVNEGKDRLGVAECVV
jgi:hypothetical protein